MAGMAWTLHPALFYEKYGTVLVQLWESGAFGTMFRPVRRLSKSIGDRITSLRLHGTVAAPPKAEPEAEVLTLTDESVATDDEALSRVNREPGDTSPEPSTSQQNELAFQGDIYTQMRRSRRQRERLLKIQKTREKFLEGASSSSGSRKQCHLNARRGSIMAFKKDKGFRKAAGGGTPLTDMEGVAPTRAVVIDVSSASPASEGSTEDDDDAAGTTAKPPRKKGLASPPPDVRVASESQTETASLASTAAADQAAVENTPPPKNLAEPLAAAKSPRKSALHKRKASRRASVASWHNADEQATKPAREKYPATTDSSSAVAGKARPPQADFASATSLLSTKEPITSDKRPAPPSPTERVAKKDKARRRKRRAGNHKKKARDKSSKTTPGSGAKSPTTLEDSYTGGDVDSGAVSEDKPRRKHEMAGTPSQDKARSRVARRPIASRESLLSTSATARSQAAEAARSDLSAHRQSSAGKGSRLGEKIIKQDSAVTPKTAPPHGLSKRTASKREERIAEAKPSVQTPVDAPRSSEAVGTSAVASREATGVHRRRAKKHRTSKSPARVAETPCGAATSARDAEPHRPSTVTPRPVSSDSAERVFDEVVAVHHHRRRSHSRPKQHAKEDGRRRHPRKTKGDRPVESTSPATGGEPRSAMLANVSADVGGGPSGVEVSTAATAPKGVVAESTTTVASAPSARCRVLPPTADVTMSGTDTMFSLGGERRPPTATTAVKGDDVTVHVDLTSRDRAAMFWPFGRRGRKKKK
ncbi:hypothetical protein HPB49_014358 [Dermacentor silvarum]|uniref:Uncharacterized protein n=1 Tax=Dermacentor silvarum TaxID=543639 RepID=A0ACB8C460_DERSI|nr:hypothetical protein HPB49_014358 [Dermacentor silvarum]